MFKFNSHFLFYNVQCIWLYVEVFEPFGLGMVINMGLFSFFYMLISSMAAPFVKYAVFFPFDIFCFFVKNQVLEGLETCVLSIHSADNLIMCLCHDQSHGKY